jgi:hypothetical protein
MGSLSSPGTSEKTVGWMFNKGYEAATHNLFDHFLDQKDRPYTSRPLLEDNDSNGEHGSHGWLNGFNPEDEGYLAARTYL